MSAALDTPEQRPEVSTWVGTPAEMRHKLPQKDAQRVVVISFNHLEEGNLDAIVEAVRNIGVVVSASVARANQELIERTVDLFVPRAPASPLLIREAAMQGRARAAVLESGDWLTAAEVAQVAGLSKVNPSAQPNKWKKLGQIFAIQHHGVDYFPSYGLDADIGYRPVKAMAEVIQVLAGIKDGWGLAYWFASDNSFLGGKRPKDLLKVDPERVIAAARDEVEELAHG